MHPRYSLPWCYGLLAHGGNTRKPLSRLAHDWRYSQLDLMEAAFVVNAVVLFESHAAIATASGIEPRTVKLLRAPRSIRATTRTELHQLIHSTGNRAALRRSRARLRMDPALTARSASREGDSLVSIRSEHDAAC